MNKQRLIGAAIVIAIAGASFFGGMQYEKHTGTTTANASGFGPGGGTGTGEGGRFGGGFGGQRGQRPTFGTIKSIDGSTLTVTDSRDTSTTYTVTISSSTTITNSSGATASASDLAVGDTVLVRGATSGTTVTATEIRINPSFGGGMGAPSGQGQGSSVN